MNIRPYIGITDFTDFSQVERMLNACIRHRQPDSKRILHVGVMMSHKTLNDTESSWTKVFPPKESIIDIFRRMSGCEALYCLHYADYENKTAMADISKALGYAGPFVNALQLDMPWPDPDMIVRGIHASRKRVEVILQIGAVALKQVGDDPIAVVRQLEYYRGIIDRVLLDKSMGHGRSMDAAVLLPFARAIKEHYPHLGLVAAGGLGPHTIALVEPLVKEFPHISIDAQGKLRPSGDAHDPIDWDMAEQYLVKALELLK